MSYLININCKIRKEIHLSQLSPLSYIPSLDIILLLSLIPISISVLPLEDLAFPDGHLVEDLLEPPCVERASFVDVTIYKVGGEKSKSKDKTSEGYEEHENRENRRKEIQE
jgi:hypothetical protein